MIKQTKHKPCKRKKERRQQKNKAELKEKLRNKVKKVERKSKIILERLINI
jgi:hypothetical protein